MNSFSIGFQPINRMHIWKALQVLKNIRITLADVGMQIYLIYMYCVKGREMQTDLPSNGKCPLSVIQNVVKPFVQWAVMAWSLQPWRQLVLCLSTFPCRHLQCWVVTFLMDVFIYLYYWFGGFIDLLYYVICFIDFIILSGFVLLPAALSRTGELAYKCPQSVHQSINHQPISIVFSSSI